MMSGSSRLGVSLQAFPLSSLMLTGPQKGPTSFDSFEKDSSPGSGSLDDLRIDRLTWTVPRRLSWNEFLAFDTNAFNPTGRTCPRCKDRSNCNKKKDTTPMAVAA